MHESCIIDLVVLGKVYYGLDIINETGVLGL
jgi:hypothetical protein